MVWNRYENDVGIGHILIIMVQCRSSLSVVIKYWQKIRLMDVLNFWWEKLLNRELGLMNQYFQKHDGLIMVTGGEVGLTQSNIFLFYLCLGKNIFLTLFREKKCLFSCEKGFFFRLVKNKNFGTVYIFTRWIHF